MITVSDDTRYLTPPLATVWSWSREGDVAEWDMEGSSIFVMQICAVLPTETCGGSLPPLTALMGILHACRQGEVGELGACVRQLAKAGGMGESATKSKISDIVKATSVLGEIGSLPAELRTGNDAVLRLVNYIAAETPEAFREPISANLQTILMAAASGNAKLPGVARDADVTRAKAALTLKFFGHLYDADVISAERIASVERTSFDRIPLDAPEEIEIPSEPDGKYRDWLNRLTEDESQELATSAQMAIDAASVLMLPRPINDPADLPTGGVSDIANRGSPERLLMTELAQDDLVMMTRIAMGQALYVRREAPPDESPLQRVVVLDAGIRTWGQARILISAIAMAAQASGEDQRLETLCFSVDSGELIEIDMRSRTGIEDQLARLTLDLHPGSTLEALAERLEESEGNCEPLVIVARDSVLDGDFTAALSSFPSSLLVADVHAKGEFRLSRWTSAGCETLQSGKLEATIRKAVDKPLSGSRSDLPLFLRMPQTPLLVALAGQLSESIMTRDTIYSITRDRRLLKWDLRSASPPAKSVNYGALELDSRVPHKSVWLWHNHTPDSGAIGGRVSAVVGSLNAGFHLLDIDESSHRPAYTRLEGITGSVHGFYFTSDDHLLVVTADGVSRLCTQTGQVIGNTLPMKLQGNAGEAAGTLEWMGDRHFYNPNTSQHGSVEFGHWGGEAARSEGATSVHFRDLEMRTIPSVLIPTPSGPLGLMRIAGMLVTTETDPQPVEGYDNLIGTLRYVRSSLCGTRHQFSNQFGPLNSEVGTNIIYDQSLAQVYRAHSGDLVLLETRGNPVRQCPSVRNRFTGMASSSDGLFLASKNETLRITFGGQTGMSLRPGDHEDAEMMTFHREPASDFGFRLLRCQWEDGRKVWLDGRGMLHLVDPDQSEEVTLVLEGNTISGWLSDGTLWGNPYFTGADALRRVPAKVIRWFRKFYLDRAKVAE